MIRSPGDEQKTDPNQQATSEEERPGMTGYGFKNHDWVDHTLGEYVRGGVHTNSVEGFFSIMKRGLNGIYQHVSEKHLKRYLGEYDFRYTYRVACGYDDRDRVTLLLQGISGKRLMYRE